MILSILEGDIMDGVVWNHRIEEIERT